MPDNSHNHDPDHRPDDGPANPADQAGEHLDARTAAESAPARRVVRCTDTDGAASHTVVALSEDGEGLVLEHPTPTLRAEFRALRDIEDLGEAITAVKHELLARHAHNDNPYRARRVSGDQKRGWG